jgi:hypothetical protein
LRKVGGVQFVPAGIAQFPLNLAFRSGMAVGQGPASLIQPVVTAASLTRLAEQLCMQEWLRSLPAAELEAVWRGGTMAVAP